MTYLGMIVERSLLLKLQIKAAVNKAEKMSCIISRLMPNIGG